MELNPLPRAIREGGPRWLWGRRKASGPKPNDRPPLAGENGNPYEAIVATQQITKYITPIHPKTLAQPSLILHIRGKKKSSLARNGNPEEP